mgnify:CR=1 FL=1
MCTLEETVGEPCEEHRGEHHDGPPGVEQEVEERFFVFENTIEQFLYFVDACIQPWSYGPSEVYCGNDAYDRYGEDDHRSDPELAATEQYAAEQIGSQCRQRRENEA